MILTIWLLLSVVILGYLWFQWDKLSILIDGVKIGSDLIKDNIKNENVVYKHDKVKMFTLSLLSKFRKFIWV